MDALVQRDPAAELASLAHQVRALSRSANPEHFVGQKGAIYAAMMGLSRKLAVRTSPAVILPALGTRSVREQRERLGPWAEAPQRPLEAVWPVRLPEAALEVPKPHSLATAPRRARIRRHRFPRPPRNCPSQLGLL
jgi:hypothetical protein